MELGSTAREDSGQESKVFYFYGSSEKDFSGGTQREEFSFAFPDCFKIGEDLIPKSRYSSLIQIWCRFRSNN